MAPPPPELKLRQLAPSSPMRLQPPISGSVLYLPWEGRVDLLTASKTDNSTVVLARLWRRISSQLVVLRRLETRAATTEELDAELQLVHALTKLRHQNLQALLGTCSHHDPRETFIVSEYVVSAPVLEYLSRNPSSDRRQVVDQVACGLEFLHGHGVVHGRVCSDNVRIARDCRVVLAGLGPQSCSPPPLAHDTNWMQPSLREDQPEPEISIFELQQADDPRYDYRASPKVRHVLADGEVDIALAEAARSKLNSDSLEGDIFAFGFVIVEILTGIRSCSTPSALRLLRMVLNAARPPHPGPKSRLRGLDDGLWQLCLRSWRLPGLQPVDMALLATSMAEPRTNAVICPVEWTRSELEAWIDKHIHKFTVFLKFERVEPSRDVDENLRTIRIGVKKGKRKMQAKLVTFDSMRRLRTKLRLDFYGEVVVWSQMRHPNLLPLLGLCQHQMAPAFVVPWIEGGSCVDFLRTHPDASRLAIAGQVAAGLTYMHTRTPAIVHGDIRAHIVVFTADGVAQLSNFDFGPQQDPIESFDKSLAFTDGPLRNAAPDFVDSRYAHRTTWSDVYSFAMFMYELYSGHAPFDEIEDYLDLLETVKSGRLPDRPEHPQMNDDVWAFMLLCWRHRPMSRPTMQQVQRFLEELASGQRPRPLTDDSPR